MYIFQPERYLLVKQIKKLGHYIHGRVLDVGAGSFDRYSTFFKYDEYIRMDIFEGPNIDVLGSADALPFPDASFDSLVSTQVFEHLADPFKAAQEAFRVLKRGGVILVTVPQINELHEEPHDYWRYTRFGLQELFEKQGFELVQIDKRGGFFTVITQTTIRYCIDRFNLYQHRLWGRIFNKLFSIIASAMMYCDSLDNHLANRKNALGWCAVFKKP